MALNKTALKASLISVFTNQYKGTLSSAQTVEINDLADGLANAFDTFVKTGAVNTTVAAAIPVQVTPATGTGVTTGTGTGTGNIT